MILRRRPALNGVWLDEVDERIVISGINEPPAADNIAAQDLAGICGQRVTEQRRATKDVEIRFRIWLTKNQMAEREAVLEKVVSWAAPGGYLTLGHKPGRRLRVILAQAPTPADIYNWTDEYTITFRAYTVPFWEDETALTATSGIGASGYVQLQVPGNTETPVDVRVQNMSGAAISTVELTVAGQNMKFSGLGLGGSSELILDHVDTGTNYYFRARIGNTSVLQKRTGADEFIVKPGAILSAFGATRAVRVTLSVRGRYL